MPYVMARMTLSPGNAAYLYSICYKITKYINRITKAPGKTARGFLIQIKFWCCNTYLLFSRLNVAVITLKTIIFFCIGLFLNIYISISCVFKTLKNFIFLVKMDVLQIIYVSFVLVNILYGYQQPINQ